MSFNLLEVVKSLFTSELVSKASSYLGESEGGVSKAMSGILPSVLGGIINKATTGGSHDIAQMAKDQHESGIAENLGGFLNHDGGGLLNKGSNIISSLFGNNSDGLMGLISNFAGVKSSTTSSLLSMAAPVILGLLGKHAASNNLNANSLSSFLSSQKDHVAAAMPSGFNLSSILGDLGGTAKAAVSPVTSTVSNLAEETTEKTGSALKWLVPLLLLGAAAFGAYYLFNKNKGNDTGGEVQVADTSHQAPSVQVKDTAHHTASASKLDADGNYIYEEGTIGEIPLPNGTKLNVGINSFEANLIKFLNDRSAPVDTVKGNWYELTNVHFKTGGSEITDASMAQLKNLVAISLAYPHAQFKLGGYTDSDGKEAGNIALSQKRADAVLAMLLKSGMPAASLAGAKGYGPAHPLQPNDSPEHKAQNRRVAVNVKAK
jgi:outer membrane protein OmpA-like peptidoglycan-associated protein